MKIINPHEGAASLAVHAKDGRVLLAIHQDGTVTGEVADASEAGARFVSYLREHLAEPEWEYGVEHVQVDGWVDRELHLSRADAEEDYRTCGMNCTLMCRRKAGPWKAIS